MDAAENGTAAVAAPPVPPTNATDPTAKAAGGAAVADAASSAATKTAELAVVDTTAVDKDGKGDKKDGKGEEEDPDKGKSVGTGKLLFKYATALDVLYMFLGTCSAIVCG